MNHSKDQEVSEDQDVVITELKGRLDPVIPIGKTIGTRSHNFTLDDIKILAYLLKI